MSHSPTGAGQRWHHIKVLAGFIILSCLFRVLSFHFSVINHDESTYLVIADALLNGYTYWVDVIDTKPIGIFLLFAGIQELFGHSIVMHRLIAALWIAATAFFLYHAKRASGSPRRASVAAGIMYIGLTSIYTQFGISPNTELFFNLFTIIALWLLIRSRAGLTGPAVAGLSLGLGFIIKYVVLFDALALGLFFLVRELWQRQRARMMVIGRYVLMALAFALPFLGVWYTYYTMGYGEEFTFYTFELSGRYLIEATAWQHIKFFFDFNLRFIPLTVLFYFILFRRDVPLWQRRMTILWGALAWVAILLPGRFFAHYTIQFMLPLSFLAAEFYGIPPSRLPGWIRWLSQTTVACICLGLFIGVSIYHQKKNYIDTPDHPRQIAAFLNARMQDNDKIYTANADQVIYFLTDRHSPVKYAHASLLWEEVHIDALMIDVDKEVTALLADPPRFIIVKQPLMTNAIDDALRQEYEEVAQIGESTIYALRDR